LFGAEVRARRAAVNSRLDTLQAVVLPAKLRRLAAWNAARREAAGRYHELLAGRPGVVCPCSRRRSGRPAGQLRQARQPGAARTSRSLVSRAVFEKGFSIRLTPGSSAP